MLTTEDNALLEKRGIDPETVIRQVEHFRTGFPYLRIFDSARPGEGITILTPEQQTQAVAAWDTYLVLGAQVQGDEPSLTLKKRLDKTLEFMQEHPDRTVIVSGGQGPDEAYTEASVMARYLIEHGADASRIIEEDKASNTRENLLFSAKLAEAAGLDTSRVLIVTSDFHMCRAKYIARTLSMDPYGQASDTWPWILKVNYTLREVFAFAKAFWQAARGCV